MSNYTAEQMREYQGRRREMLRAELLVMLGGKCVQCGTVDNLQFDHIDPKTKLFAIASGLDKPRDILLAEVRKCQLLCFSHHVKKSRKDGSRERNKPCGERIGTSKLTEQDVQEIRCSPLSQRKIALLYGISRNQVNNIRTRKSWAYLPEPESGNLVA